ncbi:MAG TPA: cbb3-type cytochrome c oxidase subunit I, partial [Steroidobacteraceae bacterium]|nr:cbb3-type cytochrome c oxidase subunit I [Steroidobacteraceae bacterium]
NGGLTGLFLGNVTVDVPLSGTYFVVAHFHMVMGVSPILVVFGAIYHWYPKITGRMLNDTLGRIHFWGTFLGTYSIYLPMHYLGILGVPRRYFAYSNSIEFIPPTVQEANRWITISAVIVAVFQMVFLFNLILSYFKGKASGPNPWRSTTLEWQTPDTPPKHGNWGKQLPVVHRWAYDYSVPGAQEDFIPQNAPADAKTPAGLGH